MFLHMDSIIVENCRKNKNWGMSSVRNERALFLFSKGKTPMSTGG